MAASLLLLLDDITSVLDDVATITKVAAAKTAGVVGDDLALNAKQIAGVQADRELPVVWAVARGSAVNKLILVPIALAVSLLAPWAIVPLLMAGGAYLCYEGVEKILHALMPTAAHGHAGADDRPRAAAPPEGTTGEQARIAGAIRTDFILSAEIMVIALGVAAGQPLVVQVGVLTAVAALMTVGVYGLVAAIIKIDDLGLLLARRRGASRSIGLLLLRAAPALMRLLSIAGTVAMFLVGGGIVAHGLPWIHRFVEGLVGHVPDQPVVARAGNEINRPARGRARGRRRSGRSRRVADHRPAASPRRCDLIPGRTAGAAMRELAAGERRPQGDGERIVVLAREAEMQVPPPALRTLEPARHPADRPGRLVAGVEIAVHSLGRVEPGLLARVGGEGLPLHGLHAGRVDEQVGHDRPPQAVAESVRHRVIDRNVAGAWLDRRIGGEVGHAAGKGGRDGQSRGVHMVFHVVVGRVREHDPRPHASHHGRQPAQEPLLVHDAEIRSEALVERGPEDRRRRPAFSGPNPPGLVRAGRHAAAVATREIEGVRGPACLAQQ